MISPCHHCQAIPPSHQHGFFNWQLPSSLLSHAGVQELSDISEQPFQSRWPCYFPVILPEEQRPSALRSRKPICNLSSLGLLLDRRQESGTSFSKIYHHLYSHSIFLSFSTFPRPRESFLVSSQGERERIIFLKLSNILTIAAALLFLLKT